MSAFKQSMRKLGVRAGLLAGASAAVLAISGVTAGSALAAPNCTPEGVNVQGAGSSLQKSAEEIWTGREVPSGTIAGLTEIPHKANALANSYREKCAAKTTPPTVSYTSTGSGPALEAFRFTGAGTEINHKLSFIGTDDAPSAAQITHAQEVVGTSKAVIVPVSQTAIAVLVHPPANCALGEITWADLNKVFGGNGIKKWSEFSTKKEEVAGACNSAITRVVRAEGSGTTYQFKNYLQVLHTEKGAEKLPCKVKYVKKPGEEAETEEWKDLEPSIEGGKPNITWPQCAESTTVVTAAGGGALAEKVAGTAGTIGYASLPDAKAKGATAAKLQNGEVGVEKTYAEPGNKASETARCVNSRYDVPTGGKVGESGVSVDWSTVFGAVPSIGGKEYPLCTLTYLVGWTLYEQAGYGVGSEATIGKLTQDYIKNYVVPAAEGQAAIAGKWYSALPSTEAEANTFNVQGAAALAAEKVN